MNVSLDQAIEMHASALKRRAGPTAPRLARERARSCALAGDEEGGAVWLQVAYRTETLLLDAGGRRKVRQRAMSALSLRTDEVSESAASATQVMSSDCAAPQAKARAAATTASTAAPAPPSSNASAAQSRVLAELQTPSRPPPR